MVNYINDNDTEDGEEIPTPPLILGRSLEFFNSNLRIPRQAWVENLDSVEERKLGLVELHPSVFGAFPRTEIISDNITWQTMYKRVVGFFFVKVKK
jgi:large subunit ribosomal protein L4